MSIIHFTANDAECEIETTGKGLIVRSDTYTVRFDDWEKINAGRNFMKDADREYTIIHIQSFEAPITIALDFDDEARALEVLDFITP